MRFEPVFFDIETTGLNPLAQKWWDNTKHDGQVICVGVGVLEDWRGRKSDAEMHTKVFSNPDEYALMDSIGDDVVNWVEESLGVPIPVPGTDSWDEQVQPFFVGWNNRSFDHPYMGARFARLRKEGYPFTHGWKRLDAMNAIQSKTGRIWSQDDWMEEVGVRHEDDITGADVPDMFDSGHIDKIRNHCYTDIQDLQQIFLEDRDAMMQEFYDHYNVPADPDFTEEVELK